jgi:hypothetical protein
MWFHSLVQVYYQKQRGKCTITHVTRLSKELTTTFIVRQTTVCLESPPAPQHMCHELLCWGHGYDILCREPNNGLTTQIKSLPWARYMTHNTKVMTWRLRTVFVVSQIHDSPHTLNLCCEPDPWLTTKVDPKRHIMTPLAFTHNKGLFYLWSFIYDPVK